MQDITVTRSMSMRENLEKYFEDSWYFTREAQVLYTVSGSVSAASSILVISIILRSQTKLSSAYHRIMFFMAFWDIISSVGMALTTIPMPKDVIYPYVGRSYGNEKTCAAQGFIVISGQSFAILANCVLNYYYILTIRYGMTEETANNRFLPILFIISFLVSIPIGGIPLWLGLMNPRPLDTKCNIATYPLECHNLEGVECIRGGDISETSINKFIFGLLAFCICICFLTMVVSLVLVVVTVSTTAKKQQNEEQEDQSEVEQDAVDVEDGDSDSGGPTPTQDSRSPTKIWTKNKSRNVLRLATMYIGAFMITWVWTIIGITLGPNLKNDYGTYIESDAFWSFWMHAKAIFLPSQGFFNSLIFIYNKICLLRDSRAEEINDENQNDGSNQTTSFLSDLKIVIMSPYLVTEIAVSNIEMVEKRAREIERFEKLVNDNGGMSEISSAKIPPSFESIQTPSFAYSNVMSIKDLDSDKEREIQGKGDPSKRRSFYTFSLDMFEGRSPKKDDMEDSTSPQVVNESRESSKKSSFFNFSPGRTSHGNTSTQENNKSSGSPQKRSFYTFSLDMFQLSPRRNGSSMEDKSLPKIDEIGDTAKGGSLDNNSPERSSTSNGNRSSQFNSDSGLSYENSDSPKKRSFYSFSLDMFQLSPRKSSYSTEEKSLPKIDENGDIAKDGRTSSERDRSLNSNGNGSSQFHSDSGLSYGNDDSPRKRSFYSFSLDMFESNPRMNSSSMVDKSSPKIDEGGDLAKDGSYCMNSPERSGRDCSLNSNRSSQNIHSGLVLSHMIPRNMSAQSSSQAAVLTYTEDIDGTSMHCFADNLQLPSGKL